MENKLISMTDFVLELEKPVGYYEDQNDFLHKQVEFMSLTMNYAKFLKQHLTLGMFFPTDKNGNVLKKPINYDIWEKLENNEGKGSGTLGFIEHKEYKEGLEKVLFKGFEKRGKITSFEYKWGEIQYLLFNNGNIKFYGIDNSEENRPKYDLKTVEDLLKLYEIELTQSVLQKIGLI